MSYYSPIHLISQWFDEQIKEMQTQEETAVMTEITKKIGVDVDKDELIRALNYDRHQYEKGYTDGRFFGIREVMSKLVYLKQCQAIPKEQLEYYGEERTAEYKEFIKRQICNEIGRYLYENNLVTFTESDGFENTLILRGDVQVYNEKDENVKGENSNEVNH